jgi:hypothetical protein
MKSFREMSTALFALGVWPVMFMACPSAIPAQPPANADASPAPTGDATVSDCQTACDAMARVGCIVQADCARVMCAANADIRFTHYNTACLARVLVPTDVAVCGVACSLVNTGALEGP